MASRRALLLLFSGLILRPTLGSQSSSQEVVAESRCAVLSLSAQLSQVLQEGLPGDQSLREEAVGIARRRASQVHSLVFADPASAIRLALTDDQRRQLVSELPELDLLLEESGQWRGSVDVFYDEDFPSGASRMRYVLAQGAKLLEVVPTADNPRVTRSGVVTVTGVRIGAAIAARSIEVEQKAVLTPACTPLGGLRVAVVYLEYPSKPSPIAVLTPEDIRDTLIGTTHPSVDSFFREISGGRSWIASVDIYGPVRLSRDYDRETEFVPALMEAYQAIDPVLDYTKYDRLWLLWPDDGKGAGWGGSGQAGCCTNLTSPTKGQIRTISESNFWVRERWVLDGRLEIIAHEGGHNYGLNHANTLDFAPQPVGPPGVAGVEVVYGDRFSNMGTTPIYQGHFLAPHWAARHKQMLGWLDAGKHVLDVVSDGTFRLAPVNGASDGLKALRVRRFAQGDQWFWIEYRQPIGFDAEVALLSPQAFTGLLIRYEDPAQPTLPESTALLDFTADSTPHVFTDPALASGKSWTDPHGGLAVQVFGADSTGISVNIRVTPPCVAASGSTLTHSYLAQTAVLPFTAPPDCSWSAQSGASWITIVGTSSGTGSGSITYRLEANDAPNAAARSGAIYVGGQVFTVTQDRLNLAPAVLPATLPASALYERTQVLEFGFTDPNGVADLREIEVLFNTSPDLRGGCGISYNVVANSLRISGPDAQWSASIAVGSMETLVTSLCSLDVAKSSVRSSGSNLVLTLALSFRDGLGPSAGVYLSVTDSGGLSSGWQRAGALALRADTKTVAAAPVLGPGTGAEKTFVFRFSDPRGPDDLNMLFFYFYGASDPRSCVLNIFPFAGRYVSLADDASGSFINPAVTGTSGTQQNALCAIDVSKMTIDTASNVASVTLPMALQRWFQRNHQGLRKGHR